MLMTRPVRVLQTSISIYIKTVHIYSNENKSRRIYKTLLLALISQFQSIYIRFTLARSLWLLDADNNEYQFYTIGASN